MRLTHFTDYSLRVLIYLALKGEKRSTIADIAERFSISRNHLMKVVQELSHCGYITAIRGKHGGLLLQRVPEAIALGELIRQLENGFTLVECFSDNNQCAITPACQLRFILQDALNAFLEVLDRYTLADLLTHQEPALIKLLQLDASPSKP
ncbi:Rrf2 family transcriptional regulator [Halomonas halocynthiae]|uniref:Rrf2 family transcriptional regulator n=1 Tax=Halomonas halocynthiae TaxID=176290 RepID=UPI0004016B09|nr:Rrf2 family transcriptional regulator [Halomonas halocynthiae]